MKGPWTVDQTTAVVLAGGQAQRMEGRDKGLEPFLARPLATHVVDRLRNQSAGAPALIAINANRNLDSYSSWSGSVWPDGLQGYQGPLAGFLTALRRSPYPFVLTVPCDCPLFPLDLLQRLGHALNAAKADIAMVLAAEAGDADGRLQAQPVFCLMHRRVVPSLEEFMDSGRRKIDAWVHTQAWIGVPFDREGDDPRAFANANTRAELDSLEKP